MLTNPPSWEVFSAGFNMERFSVLKTLAIFNINYHILVPAVTSTDLNLQTYSLDTDEDAFSVCDG